MAKIQFWNGKPLIVNGKLALDANCCCGQGGSCPCVADLPDILYATVEWPTGTSVGIQLDLTDYYPCGTAGPDGTNTKCVKFYEGTGVFGAGPNSAIIRLAVWAPCGGTVNDANAAFISDFCLGLLPWPDSDYTDATKWQPLGSFTCNPFYGDHSAAPPSACGPWTTGFNIIFTS